jgi:chemotaxis protein CheC
LDNFDLNELQHDSLIELLNISVGTSASVLSEMAHSEIRLSVPQLYQIPRRQVIELIEESTTGNVVSINMETHGFVSGESMLIFSEESSLSLVEVILQGQVPLELLTEMAEEALIEVGNVVLGTCLSTLADLLDKKLTTSVPFSVHGSVAEVIGSGETEILFLRVNFSHEYGKDSGFITLMFDVASVDNISAAIDAYLKKLNIM